MLAEAAPVLTQLLGHEHSAPTSTQVGIVEAVLTAWRRALHSLHQVHALSAPAGDGSGVDMATCVEGRRVMMAMAASGVPALAIALLHRILEGAAEGLNEREGTADGPGGDVGGMGSPSRSPNRSRRGSPSKRARAKAGAGPPPLLALLAPALSVLTSLARGSAHLKQLCVESYTLRDDLSAMLCLLADDSARDEWSMSASSAQVRTSGGGRDPATLTSSPQPYHYYLLHLP